MRSPHSPTHLLPFFLLLVGLVLFGTLPAKGASQVQTSSIKLQVDMSHPLLLNQSKQRIYLKIGLTGTASKKWVKQRAPVNIAVVFDRSTSMSGTKLTKAKEATKMVLELLKPNDIFSLISYDSTVQVLVPATSIQGTSKTAISRQIDMIYARGMTALFGGVSKGIAEVSKYLSQKRINRIILLSDGQANIGPSSPNALGRLGMASARKGISISTIGLGLGYNEDLMQKLALKSDGNHGFAKNAKDLQRLFQAELGNVFTVLAQQIDLELTFSKHIKPIRVLDQTYQVRDNKLMLRWGQLYNKQHKYIIVECEVPKSKALGSVELAEVKIQYRNMQQQTTITMRKTIKAQRTNKAEEAKKRMSRELMSFVVEAIGNETVRKAMKLRDQGKVRSAIRLLRTNASYLQRMGRLLSSSKLRAFSLENTQNATRLQPSKWNKTRKRIRYQLYKRRSQQTW